MYHRELFEPIFRREGRVDLAIVGNSILGTALDAEEIARHVEMTGRPRPVVLDVSRKVRSAFEEVIVARDLKAHNEVGTFLFQFDPKREGELQARHYHLFAEAGDIFAQEWRCNTAPFWSRLQYLSWTYMLRAKSSLAFALAGQRIAVPDGSKPFRASEDLLEIDGYFDARRFAGGERRRIFDVPADGSGFTEAKCLYEHILAVAAGSGSEALFLEVPDPTRRSEVPKSEQELLQAWLGAPIVFASGQLLGELSRGAAFWKDELHLGGRGSAHFSRWTAQRLVEMGIFDASRQADPSTRGAS